MSRRSVIPRRADRVTGCGRIGAPEQKHLTTGYRKALSSPRVVASLDFQKMRQRESRDWSSNQALQATPVGARRVVLSRRPGVPELDRSATSTSKASGEKT